MKNETKRSVTAVLLAAAMLLSTQGVTAFADTDKTDLPATEIAETNEEKPAESGESKEQEKPETETPETPAEGTESEEQEKPETEAPETAVEGTESEEQEKPETETPETPAEGTESEEQEKPETETPATPADPSVVAPTPLVPATPVEPVNEAPVGYGVQEKSLSGNNIYHYNSEANDCELDIYSNSPSINFSIDPEKSDDSLVRLVDWNGRGEFLNPNKTEPLYFSQGFGVRVFDVQNADGWVFNNWETHISYRDFSNTNTSDVDNSAFEFNGNELTINRLTGLGEVGGLFPEKSYYSAKANFDPLVGIVCDSGEGTVSPFFGLKSYTEQEGYQYKAIYGNPVTFTIKPTKAGYKPLVDNNECADNGDGTYTYTLESVTEPTTLKVEFEETEVTKDVTMTIRFMDGDTPVATGKYTFTEGVHNYLELNQYCPDGYEITEVGEFYAKDEGELDVPVEKIQKDVVMNIRFMANNGTEFVAGGDYSFNEDVSYVTFADLEKYVAIPEGYELDLSKNDLDDGFMVKNGTSIIIHVKKTQENAIVNIRFMDGDTFVAGGDYPFPKDSSVKFGDLAIPAGYELDTSKNNAESGFMARDGAQIIVHVKKTQKDVVMKIRFMDGDTFVAGGDYTLPEGVQKYDILTQYVPEGYKMSVAGDFMVKENGNTPFDVPVEKIQKDVVMKIRFMDGDTFVAGGDYTLPEGVQKYNILEKYVPEGYRMTVSGDFMVKENGNTPFDVPVAKESTLVGITVKYVYEGKDLLAVSRWMEEGVYNYSELAVDVPEGYKMAVSGDFMAKQGAVIIVDLEKEPAKNVVMKIRFMDGDTFVAGGDYTLPEGVQNYNILTQYVPEGYRMSVAGDFMVKENGNTPFDVPVEKIQKDVVMTIRFMDGDTFVSGGDYTLPEGVQNYNILTQYVPEGYRMTVSGDFMVTAGGKLDVPVEKISTPVDPTDPGTNPGGNGGDNDNDDDRYTGGNTVTRTINDDDVPLNDRPTNTTTIDDEDVPLADLPDDTVTIDDGEVPLKANPSTGDSLPFAAMAAAALSLGGVIVLNRKKK